jgi:hypothetical protein
VVCAGTNGSKPLTLAELVTKASLDALVNDAAVVSSNNKKRSSSNGTTSSKRTKHDSNHQESLDRNASWIS